VIGLTATGLVGLGLPLVVLTVTLWLLAAAAAFTVGQRTWSVIKVQMEENRAGGETPSPSAPADRASS